MELLSAEKLVVELRVSDQESCIAVGVGHPLEESEDVDSLQG